MLYEEKCIYLNKQIYLIILNLQLNIFNIIMTFCTRFLIQVSYRKFRNTRWPQIPFIRKERDVQRRFIQRVGGRSFAVRFISGVMDQWAWYLGFRVQ